MNCMQKIALSDINDKLKEQHKKNFWIDEKIKLLQKKIFHLYFFMLIYYVDIKYRQIKIKYKEMLEYDEEKASSFYG